MLINSINPINFRQRSQIKTNYQTNFKGAFSPDSFRSYKTIATAHANSMPLADKAYDLGKLLYNTEKGALVNGEIEQQISKLYLALKTQVEEIAKTRPLSDENPNQYVHIIAPQHEDPSIVCDVKDQILDATYIYPQTDDVFSFRFTKGKLDSLVRFCAADAAKLDSFPATLIKFSRENKAYNIANKTPTFLSKDLSEPSKTIH